ncbi:MAG: sensor histidine kinase [Chitinophagales bacterium]
MKKSEVVLVHILFWIAILSTKIAPTIMVTQLLSAEEYGKMLLYTQYLLPISFYVGYSLIMSLKRKKIYGLFALMGVVCVYIALFFTSQKAFAYGIAPISSVFLWASMGCLFRFFIDWFKKRNEVLLLEKENVASRFGLLRSQINPHFLFNTLHNIDALIYENQDKASQSLVKLSDIMRYMLTEAKSDTVELQKELEHLENYLSLEKLRLINNNFLRFDISGAANGLKIVPMLMIPFVENAFKHSVESDTENGINLQIRIDNGTLYFDCENKYDSSNVDKDKSHGIGLETVKKRLALNYPQKHQLKIDSTEAIFTVNLELKLNDN